jgi:hypothetical protein
MSLGHESNDDGTCACGAPDHPCATLRVLEGTNRGILRDVEHLATLKPKDRDKEIYGFDRPWLYADHELDDKI